MTRHITHTHGPRTLQGPVMIMAGGTGGHIFPGLAVAAALTARAVDVVWLGTRRGLEAQLVPPHGIEIEWISIGGLRGRGWAAWLLAPLRLAVAMVQALVALRRTRPVVVLGMGGFVTGPGGFAAWLTRRPLVIHEQNAIPGSTNRLLAPLASRVYEAFAGCFKTRVGAVCVGNPVRAAIGALPAPHQRFAARAGEPMRLLVLGGSRGARALNQLVPAALACLPEDKRPLVRHQAGAEYEAARAGYVAAGVEAEVVRFIDDMDSAYAWADLAVARAGALTVSELAAAGLGAVLVPYPHAIDDHQTRNAETLVSVGAARLLPQSTLTAECLAEVMAELFRDRAGLTAMAVAAHSQAQLGAAERLAAACIELGEGAA